MAERLRLLLRLPGLLCLVCRGIFRLLLRLRCRLLDLPAGIGFVLCRLLCLLGLLNLLRRLRRLLAELTGITGFAAGRRRGARLTRARIGRYGDVLHHCLEHILSAGDDRHGHIRLRRLRRC